MLGKNPGYPGAVGSRGMQEARGQNGAVFSGPHGAYYGRKRGDIQSRVGLLFVWVVLYSFLLMVVWLWLCMSGSPLCIAVRLGPLDLGDLMKEKNNLP